MATTVKLQLNSADAILLKRGLQKGGPVSLFLANEVKRNSDPYTPKLSGILKDTAIVKPNGVYYITPYARRQWFENRGNGLQGKQWTLRMWADKGSQIVKATANFAGVKTG